MSAAHRLLLAPNLLLSVLSLLPASLAAGEIPGAVVVLEVFDRALPADVPEAAPPRFVLLENGQVFVGGSERLVAGRLSGKEQKELETRLAEVRRLPVLAGTVTLGPGPRRQRLLLRKGRGLDMTITGDPAQAPLTLRPLAALVQDLAHFYHPSLRPFEPSTFALSAREGMLVGGCRRWTFPEPPGESVFLPRVVPAATVAGWPTGARPASVCSGDKKYIVTFRPLLPGEKP